MLDFYHVFLTISAITLMYMAPKVFVLWLKSMAEEGSETHKELSKKTQKNADEIDAIFKAPVKIFRNLRKIHAKTFPVQIVQAGAIGKDITKIVRNRNTQRAPKGNKKGNKTSRNTIKKTGGGGGDSGDPDGGDGEPPRNSLYPLQLLDEQTLAGLLKVSKKSLQNQYSKAPWTLPSAIHIPGARGPRWTPNAVQKWLEDRPQHTTKTVPVAQKKRVGRPRLAETMGLVIVKGGAA